MWGRVVSLVEVANMTPQTQTELSNSSIIDLLNIVKLSITAEANFGSNATSPMYVYIRSSPDKECWDTDPLLTIAVSANPGSRGQKTEILFPDVKYIGAQVSNPNISGYFYNVRVRAFIVEP